MSRPSYRRHQLLIPAVIAAAVATAAALALAALRPRRVEVAGASMRPALEPGDRLLVVRRHRYRPGVVVAAVDPRRPDREVVKRLAAWTGDERAVLLGDDPAVSTDSRTFGPVGRDHLRGRAVWRYAPPGRSGPIASLRYPRVPMDQSRLSRALADDLVADLATVPLPDLRSRKAELTELETATSYLRRLAQGRLDIVADELHHRRGGASDERGDLVESLSGILAERSRTAGATRLPAALFPDEAEADPAELDRIAGPGLLGDLASLDDDTLAGLVERLSAYEAELSRTRRALFDRIDPLQAELVRRYRTGEAKVDTLLH